MNRNLALALMFAPAMAAAQGYPFSQRSSITQNVALTTITIEYGRPVARGRILWGKLVPWDSVWHPGADSATRISINHDIQVAGALGDNAPISFKTLKAGEYSLWL